MRYTLILFALLMMGCSSTRTTAAPPPVVAETLTPPTPQATYAGDWEVTISDTPGGTVTGTLTLSETEEGLAGAFVAGGSTTTLRSVKATDEGMRIEFYSSEYQTDVYIQLEGGPEADVLTGKTLSTYDTRATRK
ncbi:hypothetical protein [Lewinella sp. JB7]|uniref:hypothetical protein n=1 Tax=Lewinella sp. JB7 TaxID=2962887 RepID=UPI0020C9BB0A|nr:hypothetical protein [Lewinella sp. JB7]MCP9235944.1 hypothetical protein [Lewinella sp. JB7]